MEKVELLSPAGNLDKLKYAIYYGADAVYMGLPTFGLRSNKKAFTWDDLEYGIEYAHNHNVKVYIATNIFPKNHELERIPDYFKKLSKLEPDGLIIADIGIMELAKEYLPNVQIHVSTQANTMNWSTAKFWYNYGASRIVLARELSLKEINTIKEKIPNLELETFIHGAMCMAYSGRCLISSYINMRDANHGDCTNACRWNYKLVEETRPGEYYPIEEDETGTYFFNAKDLCLVSYIPDLIKSGVCSFKIEGRTKSEYYLSIVTRAYRKAIDSYYNDPENYDPLPFLSEILTTSHRGFTSAFVGEHEKDSSELQNYDLAGAIQYYDFVAVVKDYEKNKKIALIEGKNRINIGDELEFVTNENIIKKKVDKILNIDNEEVVKIDPNKLYYIELDNEVNNFTMVRRRNIKISEEEMKTIIRNEYIALGPNSKVLS